IILIELCVFKWTAVLTKVNDKRLLFRSVLAPAFPPYLLAPLLADDKRIQIHVEAFPHRLSWVVFDGDLVNPFVRLFEVIGCVVTLSLVRLVERLRSGDEYSLVTVHLGFFRCLCSFGTHERSPLND